MKKHGHTSSGTSSLALLRDFGKDDSRRAAAIAALTPIATTARAPNPTRGCTGAGRPRERRRSRSADRRFQFRVGGYFSDPPDDMTFPGRYPYDDSSIVACAHALARLGDRRGLKHPKADVRLAAAQAFRDSPDPEVRKMLEGLAGELEPQIDKLRVSGDLTKPRNRG